MYIQIHRQLHHTHSPDNISNVNTIVADVVAGQLEYFEPKIFKQEMAPDNPVEDMLWYDTSNPSVAVLRRFHNGEWINETAQNVKQLGGLTREETLFNSLTNTFQNLNIQHSQLLENVSMLQNSEYLILGTTPVYQSDCQLWPSLVSYHQDWI
jgi:hypothetical protein